MENTKIQWADDTWNPWYGCEKISSGCKYCYMYRDQERYGKNPKAITRSKTKFKYPLTQKEPRLIFTCSLSDWFLPEADEWRDEAWGIIKKTPQHTYQILTKRPERIKENLPYNFESYKNVWIGVSVETQDHVSRLDYLQELPCITFASFEPLIGPIQWNSSMNRLDWCIVGGESGNDYGNYRYRPMELSWAEDLVLKAKDQKVACFVKQLGTYQAKKLRLIDKDGGNIEEFPITFKVRDYPCSYIEKLEKRSSSDTQLTFDF
ncbi:DUF5131 family protein [Maribacter sp. X9]|uniref:DUF5131 family protein n=1 Tax=Maribacter sp. X9 TaxID=3402159 RepID=UPI003AF39849